ncbi:FAM183A and FAM183B related-domain-containing protein [Cladochytrium replicatum]|nr:FAM183A and FAM183B related-domain-containing protein [Cladochytrium replicatum]
MADKSGKGSSGRASLVNDAKFAETIRKELRFHKLYENYMLSPSVKKNLVITNKPTSAKLDGETIDPEYMNKCRYAQLAPREKYELPITSSQVYGWDTEPLVKLNDRRFHFPRVESSITKSHGQVRK